MLKALLIHGTVLVGKLGRSFNVRRSDQDARRIYNEAHRHQPGLS